MNCEHIYDQHVDAPEFAERGNVTWRPDIFELIL